MHAHKPFEIREHLGDPVRMEGATERHPCPCCDSSDNLSVTPKSGEPSVYKCWSGCTADEIRAALGQPRGTRAHSAPSGARVSPPKPTAKPKLKALPPPRPDLSTGPEIFKVRGYSEATRERFGLVWEHGSLRIPYPCGVVKTRWWDKAKGRKAFSFPEDTAYRPDPSDPKAPKKQYLRPSTLYNEPAIAEAEAVVLTAGETDVWAWSQVGFAAVAHYAGEGTGLVKRDEDGALVFDFAAQLAGRRVYVAYDADEVGHKNAQLRAAELLEAGAEPWIVAYPAGIKDASEMLEGGATPAEFQALLDEATSWEPGSEAPRPEDGDGRAYGLQVDTERYFLTPDGVFPARRRTKESGESWLEPRTDKPIATRPIYPASIGTDRATGTTWVELAWVNAHGALVRKWVPDWLTNDRAELQRLDGAPVSLGRVPQLSDWLADSKAWIIAPPKPITSQIGWMESGDGRRFILPGDQELMYIGPTATPAGTVEGWAEGLRELVSMGPAGYLGLAVVGLAAAAPVVRLLGKRNPVIGLVNYSSSGKGTVINYGLSMWGAPGDFTAPAGSTIKGIQDLAIRSRDLPIFVDEMHNTMKAEPKKAEDALYFLGNGQRRVTSSREQKAVGGERRYGAAFYASEEPIIPGLQTGAQFRVIELDGPPMDSEARSIKIQGISRSNYGVVGLKLAEHFNQVRDQVVSIVEGDAAAVKADAPNIRGEDPFTVAFVAQGLEALASITGVELPAGEVVDWLANVISGKRAEAVDKSTDAWRVMIATIQNGHWPMDGDSLIQNSHTVAWKPRATDEWGLEINPQAPMVRDVIKQFGGEHFAKVWAERGWIERQGAHLAVKTWNRGRVWRVTGKGLEAAGG